MLTKLIDEALAKEQTERNKRERSGKFSPSLFGYCFRRQFWNRKNIPASDPFEERVLRVFACGKLFHKFVQELIPDAQHEVKLETDDVLGFADIVTAEVVYDIKTQNSKAFWYMKQETYDIAKEKEPNILQACWYGLMLNFRKAVLAFIDKDTLTTAEYCFDPYAWEKKITTEITILKDYWQKDELPPAKPRAFGGKECRWCIFRTVCAETEKERKPIIRDKSASVTTENRWFE